VLLQEGGMFDNGRWLLSNRPPVVLLADKKKAQMDEAVHEMLRCDHPRQTRLRCFQSTCRHTLKLVGQRCCLHVCC
jgi:hypothetical protein